MENKLICPSCQSNNIRKNGHRKEKQNYKCKDCDRQFVEYYSEVGYSSEFKKECVEMYLNGNGFRAIERVKKVNHNTVIRWVKKLANQIPEREEKQKTPLVAQVDELQTFVGKKKNKIWLWTVLDKDYSEILEWIIGDRSSFTFIKLWNKIMEMLFLDYGWV